MEEKSPLLCITVVKLNALWGCSLFDEDGFSACKVELIGSKDWYVSNGI